MPSFQEQDQIFSFPDDWDVLPYDSTSYRRRYLGGENAIDFVARSPRNELVFLEIKDYRGFEVQKRGMLRSGELSQLMRRKLLMTYAGLIAGSCHDAGDVPFRRFASYLTQCQTRKVIALISASAQRLGEPLAQLVPDDQLKAALHGLGVHSLVCTSEWLRANFRIECRNLPRPAAGGP